MIYVRLAGGLGNQLFQLAAAMSVSKQTGRDVVPMTEALSRYSQPQLAVSLRLLSSPRIRYQECIRSSAALRWLITVGRVGRWLPIIGLSDRSFHIGTPLSRARDLYVMDGYFQRGWTTSLFKEALEKYTVMPPSKASQTQVNADECMIHIRGGDFLSHAVHQVVDVTHYITAIQLAQTVGWSKFVVVTEDPKYAKLLMDTMAKEFPIAHFSIMPTASDPLEDFDVLRRAPARIIGNSTFSWWAAALDERRATTWSPSKFLRDLERDFFLDWEIVLPV